MNDQLLNNIKTNLESDITEIKDALKILAAGMTKLALVEERQTNTSTALTKLTETVGALDTRVAALEVAAISAKKTSAWIDRGILAVVSAAFVFLLEKIGII